MMNIKIHDLIKIVTDHQYPPIPYRNMDWVAFEDGKEEDGIYGYGKTEQEAIDDLLDNLEQQYDQGKSCPYL